MAVTYGMTTPIMSSVMPNPMTVPVMSTVMPNPMTTTTVVGSMGVQGLPMSGAIPIIVDENTPNLAEIQSFPVVVSGGGIHMHQDPVSGQRYRMSDDFHSRIPQILADRESVMMSDNKYVLELLDNKFSNSPYMNNFVEALKLSRINSDLIRPITQTSRDFSDREPIQSEISPIIENTPNLTQVKSVDISRYTLNDISENLKKQMGLSDYQSTIEQGAVGTFTISDNKDKTDELSKKEIRIKSIDTNDFSIPKYGSNVNTTVSVKLNYPTNMFSSNTSKQMSFFTENISNNLPMNSFYGGKNGSGVSDNYYNSAISRLPVNSYIDM